jgi:hypothetical protein
MNVEWVQVHPGKRYAWHAVRLTRSIEPRTLCGRVAVAGAEIRDTLPAGRSCEACLRTVARRADDPTT